MNNLPAQVEALLFALGKPLSRAELCKMLGVNAAALNEAIVALRTGADGRGIVLIDDGNELELRIVADAAEIVERVRKEEYARDIGKAGLEALSAILYRGPLTRSEVDFIRGVNSSQTLRTLLMRGLIRKIPNPRDERSFLYEPTTELLAQMGVRSREELPEWTEVRERLSKLEASYRAQQ